MYFNTYLARITECIDNRNGNELATLLTYRSEKHARSERLMDEFDEDLVQEYIPAPWNQLIISHIKCCYFILNESYLDSYKQVIICVQLMTKLLQQLKDENWCLPLMYTLAKDLRLLSIAADKQAKIDNTYNKTMHNNSNNSNGINVNYKPNENQEKAADLLMSVFRVCATDSRSAIENSKRKAMMNIINQLFKIYFRINKINLCKPLIRALENANLNEHFTLAEKVTYNYFLGIKCMFDSEYRKAERLLQYSFRNCFLPLTAITNQAQQQQKLEKNKRLILIFLIPVKMLLGIMPSKELLNKYDLNQFEPVMNAIKLGNLKEFDLSLEKSSEFFWKFGIYLILEKLRVIAYRNLFKKICLIVGTHQIPIMAFKIILEFIEKEEFTIEEVHCILANLIYEGKIKGYISLQHQKLVISKQNPFPALSSSAG